MSEPSGDAHMSVLPRCPDGGEHELSYYDPEHGTCSRCGQTAKRCPECGVLDSLHHDPSCSQPCGACEAARRTGKHSALLGRQVEVTLSLEDGRAPVIAAGKLLRYSDMGEVVLQCDDGDVYYCWPLLDIRERRAGQ